MSSQVAAAFELETSVGSVNNQVKAAVEFMQKTPASDKVQSLRCMAASRVAVARLWLQAGQREDTTLAHIAIEGPQTMELALQDRPFAGCEK